MLKGLEAQSRGNSDQAPVLRDLQQSRGGRLNGAVGAPAGGTFFLKKLAELDLRVGRSTVRFSEEIDHGLCLGKVPTVQVIGPAIAHFLFPLDWWEPSVRIVQTHRARAQRSWPTP